MKKDPPKPLPPAVFQAIHRQAMDRANQLDVDEPRLVDPDATDAKNVARRPITDSKNR